MGEQVESIEDAAELAQVRRQARQVWIKGISAGILLTLVVLFLL